MQMKKHFLERSIYSLRGDRRRNAAAHELGRAHALDAAGFPGLAEVHGQTARWLLAGLPQEERE